METETRAVEVQHAQGREGQRDWMKLLEAKACWGGLQAASGSQERPGEILLQTAGLQNHGEHISLGGDGCYAALHTDTITIRVSATSGLHPRSQAGRAGLLCSMDEAAEDPGHCLQQAPHSSFCARPCPST